MRIFPKIEKKLRLGLKAKSASFMLECLMEPSKICDFNYDGHKIFYRSNTYDIDVINEIFFRKGSRAEYYINYKNLSPSVIFDIGGNIGLAAVYFAKLFPNAQIFTFEPMPENFELLKKNISCFKNIKGFNFGLGLSNGEFPIYSNVDQKNKGGFSLYQKNEQEHDKYCDVKINSVSEFLIENNIEKIDLIKIDTEGAEHEIITAFPEEVLENIKWITGELHGNKDDDLMRYLSQWFYACYKDEKQTGPNRNFIATNKKIRTS